MKLSKTNVETLALPAGKSDAIFFDDALPGFGVRIRSGGKRTWVAQYRVNGRQRRETVGRVDSVDVGKAREAARKIFARVSLGGDPQADKVAKRVDTARTLRGVIDLYLIAAEARLRPASMRALRRYLLVHFASLGKEGVNTIRRSDVAAVLTEMRERSGPVAADRARASLSSLYSWAMREGIATDNPVIFTNRPGKAKARERVLSFAEIAAVWKATHSETDFDKIVRLLVLTGQRRGEVAGMAWSEINFDAAIWSIPSERTKNGRAHAVPLSTVALSILAAVIKREGRERVFGQGETGFAGWSRRKAQLDEASGVAGWTLHDLRRSYATHLGEMGVAPHVLEALLNHVGGSKAGVAGVYNRAVYAAEKRAAMVLWADHITAITGESATVTPLRGRSP